MITAIPALPTGVALFLADLEEEGHEPTLQGDVIRYTVVPVTGRCAGAKVETGVHVSELQGWPTVPPHWIHLPAEIKFASTNANNVDCAPGWQRHSRDTGQWVLSRRPIHIWIAHVRGTLGQAV